jgi:hypothetical protein
MMKYFRLRRVQALILIMFLLAAFGFRGRSHVGHFIHGLAKRVAALEEASGGGGQLIVIDSAGSVLGDVIGTGEDSTGLVSIDIGGIAEFLVEVGPEGFGNASSILDRLPFFVTSDCSGTPYLAPDFEQDEGEGGEFEEELSPTIFTPAIVTRIEQIAYVADFAITEEVSVQSMLHHEDGCLAINPGPAVLLPVEAIIDLHEEFSAPFTLTR